MIHIKRIDEMVSLSNTQGDIRKIENGINTYCSYSSLGQRGIPNNAGELLVKYGKDHDYQIRNKYWDVNKLPTGIIIEWVTQDVDETNGENTAAMFSEMINRIGLTPDYDLVLISDVRDTYDSENPKYMFRYNNVSKQFEPVSNEEREFYI